MDDQQHIEFNLKPGDLTGPYEVIAPGALGAALPASVPVRGLDGELIDGAVAELHLEADGSVTAEIRIPAHQD